MRTTLDIDKDILATAKQIAAARKSSTGKVISDLARKALEKPALRLDQLEFKDGFPLFPASGTPITAEMVEDMLEEEDREIIAGMSARK